MKIIIKVVVLYCFFQTCFSQSTDFTVDYENFEINIPGTPGPWLKHQDKFYTYFRTDNDIYSTRLQHQFYIINNNGDIEAEIFVPEALQTNYYDLYIKNDTIFTTEYYNQNTFYLDDKSKKWVETKKADDLFYEDENYQVYSLDFGEWGGVVWFNDKANQNQYELAGIAPVINKLNNSYYITFGDKILEIQNPKLLEESKEPYDYTKMVVEEDYFREGSFSLKGTKTIYEFEHQDYYNPKVAFHTSFVSDRKLYNIFRDSIYTKIGVIENKNLKTVYQFKEDFAPFQYSYDWRLPIQNNNQQSFQFYTSEQNKYGLVNVYKNKITVSTFINTYKENVMNDAEMKKWIKENLTNYINNFDNLKISDIEFIEKNAQATNITQKHKISHYLLDGKQVETPKLYRKWGDDNFKLITEYYYAANDKSLELIKFSWVVTDPEKEIFLHSLSMKKTIYKSKYEEIVSYISAIIGKPSKSDNEELEWIVKNKTINLDYNLNEVRLTIYKN